jgi:chorismate dehydratase
MSAVRISIVSYLNSKPFIYGLKNKLFRIPIDLEEDIPSVCAEKLQNGNADIGLVPVAVLPWIKNHIIISDYCIGTEGEVNSVLLLSDVPLGNIKTILLDYQSRTSVLLTRVLAKYSWKISPEWKSTEKNFEKNIRDQTAGVVIGDRALIMKKNFKFVYDLGSEWKKFTGLPFVFACWISTKKYESDFIKQFNEALELGLNRIDLVAEQESTPELTVDDIRNYLKNNINYSFNDEKKNALELFLKLSSELKN